jgi:hypothetical protein
MSGWSVEQGLTSMSGRYFKRLYARECMLLFSGILISFINFVFPPLTKMEDKFNQKLAELGSASSMKIGMVCQHHQVILRRPEQATLLY